MSLEQDFQTAILDIEKLIEKPSNDVLLNLYGLFKQATAGDITGERPDGFDFKGAAKYDAWSEYTGVGKNKAMEEYIALVNELLKT